MVKWSREKKLKIFPFVGCAIYSLLAWNSVCGWVRIEKPNNGSSTFESLENFMQVIDLVFLRETATTMYRILCKTDSWIDIIIRGTMRISTKMNILTKQVDSLMIERKLYDEIHTSIYFWFCSFHVSALRVYRSKQMTFI